MGAEQRRSPDGGTFLQLADNSLSDVAHRVNRADHLLLANHDLVEQAFELRGQPGVDQRGIRLFKNPE